MLAMLAREQPETRAAPHELFWWERPWALVALVLLACVPLLYPPIPPLVDLLGHMGRFRVELGHSPWLKEYYAVHWAPIGNMGVDLLVMGLGPILGLEPAVKLIVLLIPPLTVAGFLWVAREVHGRIPPTALFALPFVYGSPFLWGFVNFALSVALAFIAFALWLRLGRLGRTRLRGALFVPISLIVFFCHAYGWALLGLFCFCADAVRLHDERRSWLRAAREAALHASVMALPLVVILVWRGESSGIETAHWFHWNRKWQFVSWALRDRWRILDLASLVVAALAFAYALADRRLSLSRKLAFSAILLTISYVLVPGTVFGSDYADMRLVPYLFAVALLAIGFKGATDRRSAEVLAALGLLFYAGRIGATTASLAIAANEQRATLQALMLVPPGARVASLSSENCGRPWALQRDAFLGAMVIVRDQGFSNDEWQMTGANLLEVKYRAAGDFTSTRSNEVRPAACADREHRSIDDALARVPRQAFDFVWLIDPPDNDQPLVPGLQPVWRGPRSVLYRVHSRPSSGSTEPRAPSKSKPG